jgi:hypothetical protein
MSDVRKPNFKSVLKSVIPVRLVLNTDQTDWTYPRASPVHRKRDFMSDVRKPNFKSVLKSVIPVRLVLNIGQIGWTYPRESLVHWTCPVPLPASRAVCWTCPVLD